jgi:hypothetical protein
MSSKTRILVLLIIVTTNALSVILCILHHNRAEEMWKSDVSGMAIYLGALQATADFKENKMRLYRLCNTCEIKWSGEVDGQDELWCWPLYPELGSIHIFMQEKIVESYNLQMKYLAKKAMPDGCADQ